MTEIKTVSDEDINNARSYWADYLLKNMQYQGAIPSISEDVILSLAGLMRKQRVGKFDVHMTKEQVEAVLEDKYSLVVQVYDLINAWYCRTVEAHNFTTAPTELEDTMSALQLSSQILKTCKVDANFLFDK